MNRNLLLEDSFLPDGLLNQSVTVGFSGGADSTALLHRLFSLREELSLSLKAVHIHHGIRGDEADRDLLFAEEFCKSLGIPFVFYRLDIPALAKEQGVSIEQCGREERYRILREEAGEGLIATAHTRSDSAETVLLNLLRGTGLKGLTGIPHRRENIIRPLIDCSRRQVEDYCRRQGLSFVTDSSNLSDRYTRSFLRQRVLPSFLQLNPSFEESLAHTAALLASDEDFLSRQADLLFDAVVEEGKLTLAALSGAHPALLGRVALRFLREHSLPQNRSAVEAFCRLAEKGSGKEQLLPGVFLRVYKGVLVMEKAENLPVIFHKIPPLREEAYPVVLPKEGYGGEIFSFSLEERENPEKIYKNLLFFSVDYDTIVGKLILRQKQPGDRLSLPHGEGHKTLKKLFSEKGLTALERSRCLVLADEKGVVWVEGFGADARCKITKKTRRVLLIRRIKTARDRHEKI